jgi:DNA-directed RNA polymerase specialized sigma24 family protein
MSDGQVVVEKQVKISPKLKPHYVSNPELYKAYCEWYIKIIEAEAESRPPPDVPKYIAESIIKICTRLAYRPNFINYSFREDMIGDAIENCIRTVKNFNPEQSTNPFSFITTIAYNAFLRRIAAEHKQTFVKAKLISELPMDELMDVQDHDEETMQHHSQFIDFLRENSYIINATEPVKKRKKLLHEEEESLDTLFSDDIPPTKE